MRGNRTKIALTIGFIAASLLPWLFSSDVLELIAKQNDVLVGRYSVGRFLGYLFLTLTLWLTAYAAWSLRKHSPKEVAYRIITLLLAVSAGTVAVDIVSRFARAPRYIEERAVNPTYWPGEVVPDIVRHRPPNQVYKARYIDAPRTARSFPSAPPGYPRVDITLTTDHRGYRNLTQLEQYDIVAVGDSLTEGSYVSDDQPWPVVLGRKLNRTVYNLGIGGADPSYYSSAFHAFGLQLKPKIAIFLVYEGNDFRGIESREGLAEGLGERIKEIVEYSPVVLGLQKTLIQYLGPVNADASIPGIEIMSWMPAKVPLGPEGKYYSFKPKRLPRLYWTTPAFRQSYGWTSTAEIFRKIKVESAREGVRLIFVYAPTKARVVLQLVGEQVTSEQLHAFASFRKKDLPPPEQFSRELYARLDTVETVLREFFREEGVEFISTTGILREAMARGQQVYYTYDGHWTPLGHELVAEQLYRYLKNL